ncbi:hypothetical protein HDU99_009392 [Rhizoclosmatium hyalinum]|nr:hypothetical protein HDU99_009392 [Rhizoclosmatium hyalinum]
MAPRLLLAILFGAAMVCPHDAKLMLTININDKVAANDCIIAKRAWPEFFGAIDSITCCSSEGTVSGVHCPPYDVVCVAQCQNDSITSIELSSSTLTGPFPLFNETVALKYLTIEDTQITGPLPVLPTTLTYLSLFNNQLMGAISSLPPAIEYLDILDTGTGVFPSLKVLKRLRDISIIRCNFTGNFPDLPDALVSLFIEQTNFMGPLPILPDSLITVNILETLQTGPLPNLPSLLQLLEINNLQQLDGRGNLLSGTIPYLPENLYYIDLSNNNLTGFIPESILNTQEFYFDGNCFINANDFKAINVCQSADIHQGGFSISALTDSEYVDKALSYNQTISLPCLSNCQDKVPSFSNVATFNSTCLDIEANPKSEIAGPIVTTMATLPTKTTAVAVPIVSTADVIPPPPATTAIIVPAVTTAVPPVVLTTTTTTTNVAPLVETSSVFVPPIPQVDNSGSGGSNSTLTNSGNQGGAAADNNNNNGNNGVISGTAGADNTVGGKSGNSNMAATTSLVNNVETPKPVKSVTSFAVSPQQSLAPLPNPGFLQVTGAKAQTIVSSVLSISASFGPVDATELQNSLVYINTDIIPGAALVTVAAPVFPKTTGGMNKIVLSVDSYSFKFTSSGQVQAYNEASSSESHTMSAAQGTTATIVLVLPNLVASVLYGFELNSLSDSFVISVLKADDLATPLAKVSYSVQAQGTKRNGGKITVVMGVAKVRAEVTASAVTTVVAPAKTIGSVDAQVLITSGADFKFKMALQLLWLIL